jgi:hypothetical protein
VSDYLSGCPIDAVFAALHTAVANLRIERLHVSNPNDDNNLWFISAAGLPEAVQIDAHPGGQPPFLIEGNGQGQQLRTANVDEAVETIHAWLTSRS